MEPRGLAQLCPEVPACYSGHQLWKANTLATPNYGYEKRQRELAKKKKKEEKLRAKQAPARHGSVYVAPEPGDASASGESGNPATPAS